MLASNAPDGDFIAPLFAEQPKLAYLLHHRGYTHTILGALVLGTLLAALCNRIAKVRDRDAQLRVIAIGALAALMHVAFDFLNNYGVHPFTPFDDHWYYGDSVFIVEPWLFAALIPQLALAGKSRLGRALGLGLAGALLATVWMAPVVAVPAAAAVSLALGAGFWLQRRARGRAAPSLIAAAAVVATFALGSARARDVLGDELARAAPHERIATRVLTPRPANPLCWMGLALSTDPAGTYRARFARISLAPAVVPVDGCGFPAPGATTAPLGPASVQSSNPAIAFERELSAPLAGLNALRARVCGVDAALRFLRAPYWIDGSPPVTGDLRYDAEPGLGFAELQAPERCLDPIPPWVPPLAAALERSTNP